MKRIAEVTLHAGSDMAQVELVFVPDGFTLAPSQWVPVVGADVRVAAVEDGADVAELLDAGEKRGQNQ